MRLNRKAQGLKLIAYLTIGLVFLVIILQVFVGFGGTGLLGKAGKQATEIKFPGSDDDTIKTVVAEVPDEVKSDFVKIINFMWMDS